MMSRYVEVTKQKLSASAGQRDVPLSMGNTKCDTSRVFGVIKDAKT